MDRTELGKELDRFRVAWNTGLQNDVEPISKEAVVQGIELISPQTELQLFLAMLTRAGIGHGKRHDFNPPRTAVQVEHGVEVCEETDWLFDESGMLKDVILCEG